MPMPTASVIHWVIPLALENTMLPSRVPKGMTLPSSSGCWAAMSLLTSIVVEAFRPKAIGSLCGASWCPKKNLGGWGYYGRTGQIF
jgi:hypothetical protein